MVRTRNPPPTRKSSSFSQVARQRDFLTSFEVRQFSGRKSLYLLSLLPPPPPLSSQFCRFLWAIVKNLFLLPLPFSSFWSDKNWELTKVEVVDGVKYSQDAWGEFLSSFAAVLLLLLPLAVHNQPVLFIRQKSPQRHNSFLSAKIPTIHEESHVCVALLRISHDREHQGTKGVWGVVISQPPTVVCKMEEAQLGTRCTHVSARLALICVLSRCLLTKFLHRSSVGSLLRVRCWLGCRSYCHTVQATQKKEDSFFSSKSFNWLVRVVRRVFW